MPIAKFSHSDPPGTISVPLAALVLETVPLGIAVTVPVADLLLDAFDPWHSWRVDQAVAQRVYTFTLTGAPDGRDDVTIPVTSIQARLRDGDPTYVSVVIPSDEWAGAIAARPSGEMVIRRGNRFRDGTMQLEEIARVTLDEIRVDTGPRNQSISLTGRATTSNPAPRKVALTGPQYRSEARGVRRYRCNLDNFLRPGDTAVINGEEFVVGYMSWWVGVSEEAMEVVEREQETP